jgi:hypothetical protein
MAFLSVVVNADCPTTELNVEGRYLRAETMKLSINQILFLLLNANILKIKRSVCQKKRFLKKKDEPENCLPLPIKFDAFLKDF